MDNASTDDTTTYTYVIPSSSTSIVNGDTLDNRGNWRVNLTRPNGALRQTASFAVHEPANPEADVFVQKFQRDGNDQVHTGDNVAFLIVVGNAGPDAAQNVHLTDTAPSGATLVSLTQNSGPTCVPQNPNDCIIASLDNGDRAEFTAVYNLGGSTPGDNSASATVSSDTPDTNTGNNSATAPFFIQTGSGAGTCDLTCPTSIKATANTTEGGVRGAHVTFDAAEGTGSCGTLTATPASNSFFPVGTTVVTVTSSTGGGSCSFSVTVEEASGNVDISCPGDKTADAGNDCAAIVTLGTPTTTGDNVTVTVSRSDGQPMYDCDMSGNCTRKTTDLPFPSGVTRVTWTAYSHDTPGPYASPDDEEAHRTGNISCVQTVTVNDVTPPVITPPGPQTASADDSCQATVPDFTSVASVSDNCACASDDNSQSCADRVKISITQSPAPGTVVGLGAHTITLTANDGSSNNNGAGNTASVTFTFTVVDTTPPSFTFVPPPVTAYTGPNAVSCDAVVDPGTATATDSCSPPVTITRTPSGNTFPVGTTTITWTATDQAGNSSTATQTVTVIDNTPPVITLNGQTPSMWPPNHKYQTFQVSNFVSSVTDNCDGNIPLSNVVITQVTSDEVENNATGDGNTLNDIVIAADCKTVQLRSERDGGGNGRVYTIYFKVVDSHGNAGTASAKVVVAHNPGQAVVDSGVHYTVSSNCQ